MYNLYKKNQTRNPKKPFKYSDLMSDDEEVIFSSHSNHQSETSDDSSDESENDNAQSDELPNQNQEEYLKGMSINIFPIFSEKICLQMSLYLESYARLGLPRINILNSSSHTIDPY